MRVLQNQKLCHGFLSFIWWQNVALFFLLLLATDVGIVAHSLDWGTFFFSSLSFETEFVVIFQGIGYKSLWLDWFFQFLSSYFGQERKVQFNDMWFPSGEQTVSCPRRQLWPDIRVGTMAYLLQGLWTIEHHWIFILATHPEGIWARRINHCTYSENT